MEISERGMGLDLKQSAAIIVEEIIGSRIVQNRGSVLSVGLMIMLREIVHVYVIIHQA